MTMIEPSETIESSPESDRATIDAVDTKFALARQILSRIREEITSVERLLSADADTVDIDAIVQRQSTPDGDVMVPKQDARMLEGVFDGQHMIGSDGRQYIVPQNYSSKSKLVEGDILKLSIQSNGGFLFKQIGPIERERLVGTLIQDENTHEWKVMAEGKKYAILPASISYFKGQPGDKVVILVPKSAPSKWAAVENIVRLPPSEFSG